MNKTFISAEIDIVQFDDMPDVICTSVGMNDNWGDLVEDEDGTIIW